YAQSQGTHRLAASSGVSSLVSASDARRMTRHSAGRNAWVSRSLCFFGTVILTWANGLCGIRLFSNAQPNTVLLAAIQLLRIVLAERSLLRLLIHSCASSALIELAPRSLKCSVIA